MVNNGWKWCLLFRLIWSPFAYFANKEIIFLTIRYWTQIRTNLTSSSEAVWTCFIGFIMDREENLKQLLKQQMETAPTEESWKIIPKLEWIAVSTVMTRICQLSGTLCFNLGFNCASLRDHGNKTLVVARRTSSVQKSVFWKRVKTGKNG